MAEAEGCCRQAITTCEQARFRPELAVTRPQLVPVLLAQQTQKAKREAGEQLNDAIAEFEAMGMRVPLERALAMR